MLDPREFGISFDKTTDPAVDSTAGWLKLSKWLENHTTNGNMATDCYRVICPTGVSNYDGPGIDIPQGTSIVGQGKGTILRPFAKGQSFFNLSRRFSTLKDLSIQCDAGTGTSCIGFDRFSQSTLDTLWLNQLNPDKSVMELNMGAPSGLFVGTITNIHIHHGTRDNQTDLVPSVKLVSSSPKMQGISWRDIFFYRFGPVTHPAMVVQNNGGGRADGNVMDNIILEGCLGGGLDFTNLSGTSFTNIQQFDADDENTIVGSLIRFRSSRSKGCTANTITSSGRSSGKLGEGVADIHFDAACEANTIISLVDMEVTKNNKRSPFTVDFGGSSAVVISFVNKDSYPDLKFLNDAQVKYY